MVFHLFFDTKKMTSKRIVYLLCLISMIALSNGLQCFNCDSHDDKECLNLQGNSTALEPEECDIEVIHGGPLAGFLLGVTAHHSGSKYTSSLPVDYDCIKIEITVGRTVFENETNQVSEKNIFVTRSCSIKSNPDACDRYKSMVAAIPNSALIFCGHCDTDACNIARPSTYIWSPLCLLTFLLLWSLNIFKCRMTV